VTAPQVEWLQGVGIFAGLHPRELEGVARLFREHAFEPGSVVIREGERGARVLAFFVVREGEAEVGSGGEPVAVLRPGDHFGEMALFTDSPRNATVTARGPLRVVAMSSWDFRPFVEAHPSVGWRLLESVAQRAEELAAQ
jgi:CRP-like cAMP-binding protein